ncbi:hypothetical protein F3Y22_tig00001262pilonHSYRG00001 [Hibiscus syriacus]|uniref:Reverse transcriptase zinc-binding domain-containing protein n=1 Tax=Hibiscus syriacus TaxID=106335 RepID=A0A6A3CYG2_HIBSY|nr:hypothetical protein F3Y22_tig00001262pilonHSYRG00001 [Hibiscus syriacus]
MKHKSLSVEKDSLWRKIIVAKYNYDQDALLPKPVPYRSSSWVCRRLVNPSGSLLPVFLSELRFVMVRKSGKIHDFGGRVHDSWEWRIEVRRALFEWEKPIGAISFRVSCNGLLEDPVWRIIWFKLVPPKISAFVWKAVHQRLPVMVELLKRRVKCSDQLCCLHCKLVPEECETESEAAVASWFLWFDLDSLDLIMGELSMAEFLSRGVGFYQKSNCLCPWWRLMTFPVAWILVLLCLVSALGSQFGIFAFFFELDELFSSD